MHDGHPVVFVVDDDVSVRDSLRNLLRSLGLRVETFSTAQEFLSAKRGDGPGCLVLDVRLPGLSGLDLQRRLIESGAGMPIIFITAHGDVPMSVRAMKAGAVEFLTKPFRDQDVLDAVYQAIDGHRVALARQAEVTELRRRYELLNAREQQVLGMLTQGLLNKQIGGRMEISEAMVKQHRGRLMQKMQAESLADLILMSERLGIEQTGRNPRQ
jgi:FixJ family two-component response regulator